MDHSATPVSVGEGADRYAVVINADDTLWISYELLQEALNPQAPPVIGGLEVEGELVRFGTPGKGLGRLTYRITGYADKRLYAIAERVQEPEVAD